VIFQPYKGGAIEVGITDNVSGAVDQRDAVSRRSSRVVGERIGVHTGLPLQREQPRLARQVVGRSLRDVVVQLVVDDQHNRDDHHRDYRKRLEQQPMRELHVLSLTFLMR